MLSTSSNVLNWIHFWAAKNLRIYKRNDDFKKFNLFSIKEEVIKGGGLLSNTLSMKILVVHLLYSVIFWKLIMILKFARFRKIKLEKDSCSHAHSICPCQVSAVCSQYIWCKSRAPPHTIVYCFQFRAGTAKWQWKKLP